MTIAICADGTRGNFTITNPPDDGFIELNARTEDGTFKQGRRRFYGKIERTRNGIYFIPHDDDGAAQCKGKH